MNKLFPIVLALLFFSCDEKGADGDSAIMYSALYPEYYFNVYENDPAIPYSGSWNQYYDIISPGTYEWSFCEDFGDEITCYSGYYITFFDEGESGNIITGAEDGSNTCFELSFSFLFGGGVFMNGIPNIAL